MREEKQEQMFVITVFVLSIMVSFLFGYMVFRYEKLDLCKPELSVLPEINL
jgi:uncharacterized membrane protein AbrB (regulator of aidB expression)